MTAQMILSVSTTVALVLLALALLATTVRILAGPTLADRVLGLDMLVAIAIGFIAVIAVRTGFDLYIDIAIALGLTGFLATVAFARFILMQALSGKAAGPAKGQGGTPPGPGEKSKRRRAKTRKGGN